MTNSDSETDSVQMKSLSIEIPDEEWFEERLEDTRFTDPGDFITQMLDESSMIAAQIDELDPKDEVEVEIPSDTTQQYEQLRKSFEKREEMSLEETLSFLITSIYVQERAQFGSI